MIDLTDKRARRLGHNDRARLASCALAQLYEYYRREGRAFGAEPTVAKAAE
jgi:hypothetical protein